MHSPSSWMRFERLTGALVISGQAGCSVRPRENNLRLTEPREEVQIPPRQEVRRFIKSFRGWRDRLIAEALWLTGMRSAEVCSLPLNALPEDPNSIDTVAIKILGKGPKWRAVLFPVRLLRSIDKYIHMERRRSGAGKASGTVFAGHTDR